MSAPKGAGKGAGDMSLRACLPRSAGLSVALNAIPDAYLLLDGPHCAFRRLVYVQGNHDWGATLALHPGLPRVTNTDLDPLKGVRNREPQLEREIAVLASRPEVGGVLVDGLSMAVVTATDYQRLCRRVGAKCAKPILSLPHRSLTSDWLAAYQEVQEALASALPLAPRRRAGKKPRVALVGHLFDRNEGDHRGNLEEFKRIFEALGLTLLPPWLSGAPLRDLARAGAADAVVSLPYGRRAARVLAERIGRPLIELELPLGLPATLRFIYSLAAAFGSRARAESFVASELGRALAAIEWLVPFAFVHRRIGYIGDPHIYAGLRETAALVGLRMVFAAVTNERLHGRDTLPREPSRVEAAVPETLACGAPPSEPDELLWFPKARTLRDCVRRLVAEEGLDLLVTNSYGALFEGVGIVELGFPSYYRHRLHSRPFLGFTGALCLFEDLANTIRRLEVRRANLSPKPEAG